MGVTLLKQGVCAAWAFLLLSICGCLAMNHEVAGLGEAQIAHYRRQAESLAFPDAEAPLRQLPTLGPDRELKTPDSVPQWRLSLADAIRTGLENNPVIRQSGHFLSPSNSLLDNPDTAPSRFDVVIQDNGVLFGNRGTPAAISDYDPRFTTSLQFGHDETVPNSIFQSGGLPLGSTLVDDTVQYQSRLEQQLTTGGIVSLTHNWNYDSSNSPSRLFSSAYAGTLGLEFRQPLWAGAGEEFTAIAGPSVQRARGFSAVNQGVVIAHLNNKISQIDFESHLHNLVREIGELYWDLYLTYQEYQAEVEVRDRSQLAWDEVKSKLRAGIEGGGAADEAQAADIYFDSQARTEAALANVYLTETRLRRLLGLTVQDGRLIRPGDAPLDQDVHPDRYSHLQDAYSNRLELKRQKTNIESLRLQQQAAQSLVNPKVDLVAGYRLNGFGKQLYSPNQADGVTTRGYNSAYGSLFRGAQTGWDVGIEVTVPIFLRSERAQLRQLEFRIAKAQAALEEQELEIAHELTYSFQSLQRWLTTADTNRHRKDASQRRVDAARADYDAGRTSLDLLLRAQVSHAQAVVAYHRSLAEYNKTLWDLSYRTGTLLARNNIQIRDGLFAPMLGIES